MGLYRDIILAVVLMVMVSLLPAVRFGTILAIRRVLGSKPTQDEWRDLTERITDFEVTDPGFFVGPGVKKKRKKTRTHTPEET